MEENGGQFDNGIVRGVAVIEPGEARGHKLWIDEQFTSQVASAINAQPAGVKSRWGHPSMSGDAPGNQLGRVRSASKDGITVRGDLSLLKAASISPNGDMSTWVKTLAKEDPSQFGLSIAFMHDDRAERAFVRQHSGRGGEFQSPDPANTNNFPHARLGELLAVDLVHEGAATPNGLFGARTQVEQFVRSLDPVLAYCFGISEDAPEEAPFGFHPDRIRDHFSRFLDRHNLQLCSKTNQRRALRLNRRVTVNID